MTTAEEQRWGSAWAWFGSTIGSTCWLAIAAVVLLVRGHPGVAAIAAMCYAIPVVVAQRAWAHRNAAGPYTSAEAWFAVAWLMAIVATAAVHVTDTHAEINLPGDAIWSMWVALVLGGLLMWLAIRRWRRRGDEGLAGGLFHVLSSWF
jgi:hypothetical protein